jgi:hypothetical protein
VDHLGEIVRLESEIARLQGQQMVHMAAHVAAVEDSDRWLHTKNAVASAYAEINLVLNASGRHADDSIGRACALAADLPRTLAAVCTGRLTRYRAVLILEQTTGLRGAERATAEARALDVAAGLTPAKLRQRLDGIVARIDERSIDERRADALHDLICSPITGHKRVHWQVQVLVPVGTLLGLKGEPGYLPGYGHPARCV